MESVKKKQILCYDSGIGGITVLAQAKQVLPDENFIYFADVTQVPYGDKNHEQIRRIILTHMEELLDDRIKAVLMACNTGTAVCIKDLRAKYGIPILGLEPALKPAVENCRGKILVLATALTLQEEKFSHLLAHLQATNPSQKIILEPCPGLADLVEESPTNPDAINYIFKKIAPHADGLEGIVLGCTHYVFLRPFLQQEFPKIKIFDGNLGIARLMKKTLEDSDLLGGEGTVLWKFSETDPKQVSMLENKFQTYYEFWYNNLQNNQS